MVKLSEAAKAIKAFTEAVNENVVTPQEVKRRGDICLKCPMKTRRKSRISELLGMMANRNRVSPVFQDNACGVCGCSLLLLLPAREEDLHEDRPDQRKIRPGFCWYPRKLAGKVIDKSGPQ